MNGLQKQCLVSRAPAGAVLCNKNNSTDWLCPLGQSTSLSLSLLMDKMEMFFSEVRFFFFNGLLSLTVLSPISFLNQLLSRGNLLSIIFVPELCYTLSTGHLNSSVGSGLSSFSSTDGAAEAQRGWGICPGSHSWIWLSWYLDPGISDFQGLFLAPQATISGLDSRLLVLYTHTLKY